MTELLGRYRSWGVLIFVCGMVLSSPAFEKIVQLDQWDYNGVFDIETEKGLFQVLDHVMGVGPQTVLCRTFAGSAVFFHSPKEERTVLNDAPLDERRIPDERPGAGWLRLHGGVGVDAVTTLFKGLKSRGVDGGLYWPFEENHWFSSKLGIWNLEHPQFWCVSKGGKPFMGRCSLAFPEVLEHKLRLLDEQLALGGTTLYIEAYRTGGWTVADEYVKPNLDEWARRYPGESVPRSDDARWIALVGEVQERFFRAVRRRLDGCGRKVRFLFGVYEVARDGSSPTWNLKAIDWVRLAKEHVFDGVIIESVRPDWKHPMESTRQIYETVKARLDGAVPFFCPVMEYDYQKCGIRTYARYLNLSLPETTRRLCDLAKEVGAAGVLLECVDYGNYTPEMMQVLNVP